MTSAGAAGARARDGLRRQWRTAFVVMTAALLLALGGVTATYLQTASRYRVAARDLDAAISQTSQLNNAVNTHEIQSHQLWQGTPIVGTAAYLRGQNQISALFQLSLRDLRGPGEHALVVRAYQLWQAALRSRGLWGASAGPRPGGVTAAMQASYGRAQDQVYFTFGQLSLTAIADGSHDLALADRFKTIGIGLLIAAFLLVLMIMLHFARRLTTDVLQPIETLHAAVNRLREGSLEHRIELSTSPRPNEVERLADAFNEMAGALSASHGELARQASNDSLTGLANRASFSARLSDHIAPDDRRAQRASVLFIDVDDFKFVNDSIGHACGDALLVAVGRRLSECVRPDDFVARLGGDEFAIIVVDNSADTSAADAVARRVLEAFTTPFMIGEHQLEIAVSIGVSTMRVGVTDADGLVAEADYAMYTAKRAGKARAAVFDADAVAVA